MSLGDPAGDAAAGWHPRSFLLTDVVGSVGLWEGDADAMAAAVARHDALVFQEVSAVGGSVVRSKGEGDSTFSVFESPVAAVTAAAAIQRVMGEEPWRLAAPLRVRAGVHTGEAEGRDGDWYGPAVNRAARLRGLARGGQTLVSGVTAGLLPTSSPAVFASRTGAGGRCAASNGPRRCGSSGRRTTRASHCPARGRQGHRRCRRR